MAQEKARPKRRSTAASSSSGLAPKQEEAKEEIPEVKEEIFEESQEAVIREKPLKPHAKIQKNRQPGDELTLVEKWGSLRVVLDDSDF